jgi:hypothetical protein
MREIRLKADEILNNVSEPSFTDWSAALNFLSDNHDKVDTHIKRMLFNRCEWYRVYFNTPRKKTVRIARNSGGIQIIEVNIIPENIEKDEVFPKIYHLFPYSK